MESLSWVPWMLLLRVLVEDYVLRKVVIVRLRIKVIQ